MLRKRKDSDKTIIDTPKEAPAELSQATDNETPITEKIDKNTKKDKIKKPRKTLLIVLISVFSALLVGSGIICFILIDKINSPIEYEKHEVIEPPRIYDSLSGEEISDASLNSSPIFCMQIPNGLDGARPQSGLTEAKIVFEAIAEAGITRFAAIFKNPTVSNIGPIRSLRTYYLNWDTPFDCTITHAGGAADALAALSAGGYRDLTENYTYMYRSDANYTLNRLWNNLFTSSASLAQFATDNGYTTSNPKVFPRMTPIDSELFREDQDIKIARYNNYLANPDSYETIPENISLVTSISLDFGGYESFDPVYSYDRTSNTYLRSYATGEPHTVYICPGGLTDPTPETDCGNTVQLAPSVVIAMMVEEHRAADNYHESITTIGSGKAYIFQNGTATEGTWEKSSATEQIIFKDVNGAEISFTPGQIWISAIPNYGSVSYQ